MVEEFPLDRIETPVFYTPKRQNNTHRESLGKVFTKSADHFNIDWVTVGYVSKQTPLGQGTFLGFPVSELREATREEVLITLKRDHPFSKMGSKFRPACRDVMNANFHLIMASVVDNWTNDGFRDISPVCDVSTGEIENCKKEAMDKYNKMMKNWKTICKKQIEEIKKSL